MDDQSSYLLIFYYIYHKKKPTETIKFDILWIKYFRYMRILNQRHLQFNAEISFQTCLSFTSNKSWISYSADFLIPKIDSVGDTKYQNVPCLISVIVWINNIKILAVLSTCIKIEFCIAFHIQLIENCRSNSKLNHLL